MLTNFYGLVGYDRVKNYPLWLKSIYVPDQHPLYPRCIPNAPTLKSVLPALPPSFRLTNSRSAWPTPCYVAVCNNYAICNKLQTALNCNAVCNTLQTAFRILKNAEKRKWNKCSNKTQFEIKFHNKDFSLFLLFYFCIGISLYMIEI